MGANDMGDTALRQITTENLILLFHKLSEINRHTGLPQVCLSTCHPPVTRLYFLL